MHKGKAYPLELRARLYDGAQVYPYWPAKTYKYLGGACTGSVGSLIDPFATCFLTLDDTSLGTDHAVWRGILGTYGGHLVEIGWEFWTIGHQADFCWNFQAWIDTVAQLVGPDHTSVNVYDQLLRDNVFGRAFLNPAVFSTGPQMRADAVGWP